MLSEVTPEEIRAARIGVGLTQTEAAAVIGAALRSWQNWEAPVDLPSHRKMKPAMFELFLLKTAHLRKS